MISTLVVLGYGLLGLSLGAVTAIFFLQKRKKLVMGMTVLGGIIGWSLLGTAAFSCIRAHHVHLPKHVISFKIGAWSGGPLGAMALLTYRRLRSKGRSKG